MTKPSPQVSRLFSQVRAGSPGALEEVVNVLYGELHALAARQMRGEAKHHTLQPTALVHEAYLRLLRGPDQINDRQHFFALAATTMRRVLVDHARGKRANKRGGKLERVSLDGVPGEEFENVDVLDLDAALTSLAEVNTRASRVVELRFFGGHTDKEVCEILGLTLPTVRRDWNFARAWLAPRLRPDDAAD